MFPAHIPRKAYQVTSDDEFRQIKLSLEEKLAQGSRPTEQPIFTDPEEAGRVLMLEHAMSSQEWSVLMNLTCTLLEGFEEKGVIAVEARKALALAKHSRVAEATQTAKSAYNNHPEYFESYAAMAAACLACAQPLEAAKWFPLVIAARGGDAPWFKTMVKEQKFLLSLGTFSNKEEKRVADTMPLLLPPSLPPPLTDMLLLPQLKRQTPSSYHCSSRYAKLNIFQLPFGSLTLAPSLSLPV